MHIITGGTGRVGSALAEELLKIGEQVTIVTRSSENGRELVERGAKLAVADIYDTDALHEIFKTGKTIFVLNPPADPATNTSAQELKTVGSLLKALEGCGAEHLVVESTMGAQPGSDIGDLAVLYELEEGIKRSGHSYSIIRPAYYMSNWDSALQGIESSGILTTFYPADLKFPMVAPGDIGKLAGSLMMKKEIPELVNIQGPLLYSADDVAAAFAKALGKKVEVRIVPKQDWKQTFESLGFSEEAARSYAGMTAVSLDAFERCDTPDNVILGETSIEKYVQMVVSNLAKSNF